MFEDFKSCLIVTEDEKQKVREELGLKESVIEDDVDAILQWFQKQPHLMEAGLPDRSFVEIMLVNAKGSREKTKLRIDNFYKYRSLAPELIRGGINILNSDKSIWTDHRLYIIPKLYDLKRITVVQFTNPDPTDFNIEDLMRNSLMCGDLRLKYDYMVGDIWILDLKNTTIGHLLRMNPSVFSRATRIFLEGIGIRMHEIHILGAPSFANQLMQFMGTFVKPKLISRVKFINSLDELYKFVPKKYLPKDYGGDQLSMEDAADLYTKLLRSEKTKRTLEECTKQISDERKRPDVFIHEHYLSGTFKKLDLD